MPRNARGPTAGTFTHIVNRGNGRTTVFHDAEDYQVFTDLMANACRKVPMRVAGCCLMPNHFHLLVWPRAEGDLSRWMQSLMTSHVRRHHRKYGTSGHVWQGRYKSFPIKPTRVSHEARRRGVMEGPDAILTVLRYVERNPVRSALVDRAEDWPWSSARWWSNPPSAPVFWRADTIWRPDDWLSHVSRAQSDKELAVLRGCVRRGRPFPR